MDGLLRAVARSTLQTLLNSGLFDTIILLTNDLAFEPQTGVEIRLTNQTHEMVFHAGRVLREIVGEFEPDSQVVYIGGGAGLLLDTSSWQTFVNTLDNHPNIMTANNYFSSDFVGWKPAKALLQLSDSQLPIVDNNLAYALCRLAGLSWKQSLNRTAETLFDIDTPSDAAILKHWLNQQTKPRFSSVQTLLNNSAIFSNIPVQAVVNTMNTYDGEVVVAGRVSGTVHRLLETTSHGQTRVFSEERGMRANRRDEQSRVVSLVGALLDNLGAENFFKLIGKTAQAAIIDSRVIFAHQKISPSRADRFNSDGLNYEIIKNEKIKAFTLAARQAQAEGLAVLLGGHSAVAGGLMLLLETVSPRLFD
jgi:hypothetical protein